MGFLFLFFFYAAVDLERRQSYKKQRRPLTIDIIDAYAYIIGDH